MMVMYRYPPLMLQEGEKKTQRVFFVLFSFVSFRLFSVPVAELIKGQRKLTPPHKKNRFSTPLCKQLNKADVHEQLLC